MLTEIRQYRDLSKEDWRNKGLQSGKIKTKTKTMSQAPTVM